MKYLIVTADDFGETPGVTSGILQAHEEGIVTSTSMIIASPFAPLAARAAESWPGLSIGLHLCLTNNREGFDFNPDDTAVCRSELGRQFRAFVDLVGRVPTHLDSHHNVHRDPRLAPLFLELAAESGIPLREHSPVRYFSSFYGQWDGVTHLEQISVEMLRLMLGTEVGEGFTELSCHPAHHDDRLVSYYSIERRAELATLCDPSVRREIDELEITLIGFGDVPAIIGAGATGGSR